MVRARFIFSILLAAGGLFLLGSGCDELVTETIQVTIAGHPTAEYTYTPDSGCVPVTVSFDDASSGPIAKWIWNFGDTIFDTLFADSGDIGDVSHTYMEVGTYTVVLTVFDALDGSDQEAKKRAVIVGHNIDSVALSNVPACPGQEVIFEAFNPVGVSTWRWDFGHGTALTDSGLIQTHVYTNPGLYQFSLTVTGDCGQTILIDTVHVVPCPDPTFTMDAAEGCEPLTVTFTGPPPEILDADSVIVGVIVSWQWDFGNGTTSSKPADTVVYNTAGEYEVTLTVETDSGGVATHTDSILVWPAISSFSAVPTSACQVGGFQFLVKFTRGPTGETAWRWNFGDGDTSLEQNPFHAYTVPGIYHVALTVYGACGDSSTDISWDDSIVYYDILDTAGFEISYDSDTVGSEFTFTDTSLAAVIENWRWDYGDGNDAFGSNLGVVAYAYDSADTFPVTLTIYNSCDSAKVTDTVIVVDPPAGR